MSMVATGVFCHSGKQFPSFLPSNFEIKFVHLQLVDGIKFKLNYVVNAKCETLINVKRTQRTKNTQIAYISHSLISTTGQDDTPLSH